MVALDRLATCLETLGNRVYSMQQACIANRGRVLGGLALLAVYLLANRDQYLPGPARALVDPLFAQPAWLLALELGAAALLALLSVALLRRLLAALRRSTSVGERLAAARGGAQQAVAEAGGWAASNLVAGRRGAGWGGGEET